MTQIIMEIPNPGVPNEAFAQAATSERLESVARALEARGFSTILAADPVDAKQRILTMLLEGAEVHVALSETMAKLGLTEEIEQSGRYDAVRPKLMKLDRQTQRREMRKLGSAPDYILGSAHAITEDGVILVGSGSGSQLGPYAHSAEHVILAVGHHKIVRTIEEGLQRLTEYSLPLEYARMQSLGY